MRNPTLGALLLAAALRRPRPPPRPRRSRSEASRSACRPAGSSPATAGRHRGGRPRRQEQHLGTRLRRPGNRQGGRSGRPRSSSRRRTPTTCSHTVTWVPLPDLSRVPPGHADPGGRVAPAAVRPAERRRPSDDRRSRSASRTPATRRTGGTSPSRAAAAVPPHPGRGQVRRPLARDQAPGVRPAEGKRPGERQPEHRCRPGAAERADRDGRDHRGRPDARTSGSATRRPTWSCSPPGRRTTTSSTACSPTRPTGRGWTPCSSGSAAAAGWSSASVATPGSSPSTSRCRNSCRPRSTGPTRQSQVDELNLDWFGRRPGRSGVGVAAAGRGQDPGREPRRRSRTGGFRRLAPTCPTRGPRRSSRPVVVQAAYGLGRVTLVAIDLDRSPFLDLRRARPTSGT